MADDGKINNDLRSYRDAFLLGGLGGGVMSGAGHGVQAVRNAYRGRANAPVRHNPYREADKASARLVDLESNAARQMQFDRHNASLPLRDAEFNQGAVERLAQGLQHGTEEDIAFIRMRPELLEEVNAIRANSGLAPFTHGQVTAYKNAVNNHLRKRVNEGMGPATAAHMAADAFINPEAHAYSGTKSREGYDRNHIQIVASPDGEKYNSAAITGFDDGISLKSVSPRNVSEIKKAQAELGTSPEPRNPEGIGTSSGLGNSAEAQGPRTSTVAKTGDNVNTDLHQAYKQYGDTFYDHLTDEQQARYETMLDDAPRDAQGRYTDPITGETWIDEVVEYDGRKAVQLDDYVTDAAPEGEGRRGYIRKQIMDKFAGKDITLSNNDTARVSRQEAGKLAGASYRGQPELHTDAKINSSMYVDELGATMDNISISSNVKSGEQNAPAYIKGDVTIIIRGVPYDAELILRQLQDGTKRIYDVVIKQEAAPSSRAQSFNERLVIRDGLNGGADAPWAEPLGADSNGVAGGYSGNSVAKTDENVNGATQDIPQFIREAAHRHDTAQGFVKEQEENLLSYATDRSVVDAGHKQWIKSFVNSPRAIQSITGGGVYSMEFPNGEIVMMGTRDVLMQIDPGYMKEQGITGVQEVRIGRGKTGNAQSGQPRLILMGKMFLDDTVRRNIAFEQHVALYEQLRGEMQDSGGVENPVTDSGVESEASMGAPMKEVRLITISLLSSLLVPVATLRRWLRHKRRLAGVRGQL